MGVGARPDGARRIAVARSQTGHFKAVITKPQNVFVMRDVACAGYVADQRVESRPGGARRPRAEG